MFFVNRDVTSAGSSRPRTARVADKIDDVADLVLSQDNAPNTHRTQRQIARQTGISLTSVNRVIQSDLRLKCLKKTSCARINRSQQDCKT